MSELKKSKKCGKLGEMKQGKVKTVTITFMGDSAYFSTYDLVTQYSTPSYYHKTF